MLVEVHSLRKGRFALHVYLKKKKKKHTDVHVKHTQNTKAIN